MSYKQTVNRVQLFGEDEKFEEWFSFLRSEGIEIDEAGNYKGSITNVMGAIECLEKIVLGMAKEKPEIFDFTHIYNYVTEDTSRKVYLTDEIMSIPRNAYILLPYQFIQACGGMIRPFPDGSNGSNRKYIYTLKPGLSILVRGWHSNMFADTSFR